MATAYPGLRDIDVERMSAHLQRARNGVRDPMTGPLDGPETNPHGAWAREIEKETRA